MHPSTAPTPTLAPIWHHDWHLCMCKTASLPCLQLPRCHRWSWKWPFGGTTWPGPYLAQAQLSTNLDQRTTNWRKIVEDKATNTCYNDILLAATNNNNMPYEDFHDKTKKAGKDKALLVKSKSNDWFIFNQDYIAPPDWWMQPTDPCSSLLFHSSYLHCQCNAWCSCPPQQKHQG